MTIHIPMEMGRKDPSAPFGEREYVGKRLSSDPNISAQRVQTTGFIPVGNDVDQVLLYFREKGDMKTYYNDARAKGINGTVETWSGRNSEGMPQVTFSRYTKDAAVRSKLTKKRTTSDGKQVIDFFNSTIPVTGLSDAEITKKLGEVYDKEKAIYDRVGSDIINIFESKGDMNRFPAHLRGRETPIIKLLSHFDPDTHRMELAQSYDYLKDVGPDVIIVTDKTTGAVSFISAITTNDNHVTFQSDGSGKKRTSIIGNYVTDDYYPKTKLPGDIFTAPTAHDFIAMKLGMTALKWMAAHGNDIKIDSMMVGSVTPSESSYSITPTTMLHELRKLQLFREVAGTEFPPDIAEIMDKLPVNFGITSDKGKIASLMSMIQQSCDPMGKHIGNDFKNGLIKSYIDYTDGGIRTYEFKYNIMKYLEMVARHLKQQGKTDAAILTDPEYLLVTRAIAEMEHFDYETRKLASERVNVKYNKSAITSGDPILLRMNVIYRTESGIIRQEMNDYQREHNRLVDDLRKAKNMTLVGTPEQLFENLFIKDNSPEHRMMLKNEGSPEYSSLMPEEKAYIKFFNKHCRQALAAIAPARLRNDILKTERFWKEGSVPVTHKQPQLLEAENFKSWQALKKALAEQYNSKRKATGAKTSDINFVFESKFEGQATDEGICNSDKRRALLGLSDPSNPEEMSNDIEKNLALILNTAVLEASEKKHMGYVLHVANAMSSVLAGEDDVKRTGMTQEMLASWREMTLFNKSLHEPNSEIAGAMDVMGKAISALIFNYSVRQSMNEFFQNTSHSLSAMGANVIMEQVAKFLGTESNARFAPKDWLWAANVLHYGNQKYEKMIYDAGMLQADVDDLKNESFRALSKAGKFKSKSAQFMNKIWFDGMISQVFMAQMRHQGIDEAYVYDKELKTWVYDETKDPRFFVWDPASGIGDHAPTTEAEEKRNAKWLSTRKLMNEEGMLTQPTYNEDGSIKTPGGKMMQPLIGNESAEIKAYSLRLFGSFNKDGKALWENESLFRAMGKYKTWWLVGRLGNIYTPVVENEPMYGKWEYKKDEEGNWHADWANGDYRGVVQTVGHITKELIKYRDMSVLRNLSRYEQEVASHLISDLFMASLMSMLIMPLVVNYQTIIDENGKEKKIKGGFVNTIIGESIYKTMAGAVADLAFVTNVSSMTTNMFPVLSIAANLGQAATQQIQHAVNPDEVKAPATSKWLVGGGIRTGAMGYQIIKGDWGQAINTLQ